MKRAILFFAVLLIAVSFIGPDRPPQAGVIDNGHAMLGGGIFGTKEQAKTGDIRGFFSGSGLVPIYWDSKLWARVSFADLQNEFEVENYSGSIILFSRDLKSEKIIPYAFGSLSFTHNGEPDTVYTERNQYGLDGGLGLTFPLVGGKWYIEAAYKNVLGKDMISVGAGLIFDLSKPKEDK